MRRILKVSHMKHVGNSIKTIFAGQTSAPQRQHRRQGFSQNVRDSGDSSNCSLDNFSERGGRLGGFQTRSRRKPYPLKIHAAPIHARRINKRSANKGVNTSTNSQTLRNLNRPSTVFH